jgi:tRNA 5-methylaminomethyl-2-thiouridine biosynthesis bifunctional protein
LPCFGAKKSLKTKKKPLVSNSNFNSHIMTTPIQTADQNIGRGYQKRPLPTKPEHVSIIGGGIASACAAYGLTQNGVKVTLYCKDTELAQGASSNAIGALFPLLHQQIDDISLFYQQAFWRALQLYKSLSASGHHFSHDWCGLLEISYKPALQKRQQEFEQNNVWPTQLIHGVNQQQAADLAKVPLSNGGLFMPNAGWICPPELVNALLNAAKQNNRLNIETKFEVKEISQGGAKNWQLHSDTQTKDTEVLIVCGGADTLKLNIVNQLPLSSVRGQISNMTTNDKISPLATVICHKGYLTPKNNKNQHSIGATFDKNSVDQQTRPQDDSYNLTMLDTCLPELKPWQLSDVANSKARLRCMTPDHLPMVGPMPDIDAHKALYGHLRKDKNWRYSQAAPVIDHLYVMTGLGARGLCSAPLLADILCADICGTPYPLDSKALFNLSPNRFVIRDLIRRKV